MSASAKFDVTAPLPDSEIVVLARAVDAAKLLLIEREAELADCMERCNEARKAHFVALKALMGAARPERTQKAAAKNAPPDGEWAPTKNQFALLRALDEIGLGTLDDLANEIDKPKHAISRCLNDLRLAGAVEVNASGKYSMTVMAAKLMRPEAV